jgi:hypothetical protein
VIPPLSIKTRIQTSNHPNTTLDPVLRLQTNLEILMQNSSTEPILFDKLILEPVHGLESHPIPPPAGISDESLMPGDTRQYLFSLSPVSGDEQKDVATHDQADAVAPIRKSVFPPIYPGGTILPLGRLDVSWFSGPYRDPGRLQTSTLNRRIPVAPPQPLHKSRIIPSSPASTPGLRSPPALPPKSLVVRDEDAEQEGDEVAVLEYDLAVMDLKRSGVEVEKEFEMRLRVGVRSVSPVPDSQEHQERPTAMKLGIQYLTQPSPVASSSKTKIQSNQQILSPPKQNIASSPLSRSFSPVSRTDTSSPRPLSPVSLQLRQATNQHLTSALLSTSNGSNLPQLAQNPIFPPKPFLEASSVRGIDRPGQGRGPSGGPMISGSVVHLGTSLVILNPQDFELVEENVGTTYNATDSPAKKWEAVYEYTLRFLALDEGLAELGGLRILLLDEGAAEGEMKGSVGSEWQSLGDVWIQG